MGCGVEIEDDSGDENSEEAEVTEGQKWQECWRDDSLEYIVWGQGIVWGWEAAEDVKKADDNEKICHHGEVKLESWGPGTEGTLTVMNTWGTVDHEAVMNHMQVGTIGWQMDKIKFSKEIILY